MLGSETQCYPSSLRLAALLKRIQIKKTDPKHNQDTQGNMDPNMLEDNAPKMPKDQFRVLA